MLRKLFHRLFASLRRGKTEREMERELRFHLEMETAENIRRGMSEEEAQRTALRSFGGVEQVKEAYRDISRFRLAEELWQDVRFSARLLLKQPGFLAVAALTLALGIGASTAIFTVVNGVLIRSLPYRDPSQLVWIEGPGIKWEDPYSDECAWGWRDRVKSFEQVAVFGAHEGGVNLTGGGEAERIEALDVSANFFQTLGVSAVAGRFFGPEQERHENRWVTVISSRLWQRRFEGSPDAIGKTIQLNGKSFTIIGVAPPEVQYPTRLDAWIPLSFVLTPDNMVFNSPSAETNAFARLKSGVAVAEARAEMKAHSERAKLDSTIGVESLFEELIGETRQTLTLLMAAVGFVLLIACANVANLLLARSATRKKELAVRAALGAGRWRLIRQSLTESLLIGVMGGLAGLLLAVWLQRLLIAFSPPEIPRLDEITLDYRVLTFNAALTLLTGVMVGALPSIQGSKVDLIESLKDDAQKLGTGARALSLKSILIAGEIALSLVLLIGAGLLLRSLTKVLSMDAGFERENVLSVSLAAPLAQYLREPAKVPDFYRRLIEQVSAIPGVKAAGATSKIPLSREEMLNMGFEVEGRPRPPKFSESLAAHFSVSPDYFKAMGIPLLHGRAFTEADCLQASPVLIINETMARRVFPDGNALGKKIKVSWGYRPIPREIIGVVGPVRTFGLEEEPRKEIFLPYQPGGMPPTTLAIRTVGDPMAIASAAREAIRRLDENLPPYDIKPLEQRVSDSVAPRRFLVSLMSLFALLALALAATGIYGVLSYLVAQRTREIGIRIALGATAGAVLKLILKQGAILILIGTTIGLAGAIALTPLIKTLLFGVRATDPATYALIALLLVVVALIASYLPARRATKVDPMVALRHD
jgi:putative ABC transport system permease protein